MQTAFVGIRFILLLYRCVWSGEDVEHPLFPCSLVRTSSWCEPMRQKADQNTRWLSNMSLCIRTGFYRQEINKTVWDVPERYRDLIQVGTGAYGTVWWVQCCCAKMHMQPIVILTHSGSLSWETKLSLITALLNSMFRSCKKKSFYILPKRCMKKG